LKGKNCQSFISDLEKQTIGFKKYMKKEEEKIDFDFNELIECFRRTIEEVKYKIKSNLYRFY